MSFFVTVIDEIFFHHSNHTISNTTMTIHHTRKRNNTTQHDTTRNVTSRHVTSRHVTSRHVTSLHFTSRRPFLLLQRHTPTCLKLDFFSSADTDPLHSKWHEACTVIFSCTMLATRQPMKGQGPRTLALRVRISLQRAE